MTSKNENPVKDQPERFGGKMRYSPPKLTEYGSLLEQTQSSGSGIPDAPPNPFSFSGGAG